MVTDQTLLAIPDSQDDVDDVDARTQCGLVVIMGVVWQRSVCFPAVVWQWSAVVYTQQLRRRASGCLWWNAWLGYSPQCELAVMAGPTSGTPLLRAPLMDLIELPASLKARRFKLRRV
jgi:hypothetical protein